MKIDCLIYEKQCEEGEQERDLEEFLNEIRDVETGLTKRQPFVDLNELERWIHVDVDQWRTSRVRASRKRDAYRVFQAPSPGSHHVKRSVQERLVASLLKGNGAAVARAALHGAPGIGKSILAAAFAHDEAGDSRKESRRAGVPHKLGNGAR